MRRATVRSIVLAIYRSHRQHQIYKSIINAVDNSAEPGNKSHFTVKELYMCTNLQQNLKTLQEVWNFHSTQDSYCVLTVIILCNMVSGYFCSWNNTLPQSSTRKMVVVYSSTTLVLTYQLHSVIPQKSIILILQHQPRNLTVMKFSITTKL